MIATSEELQRWHGFYDMNDEYKQVWQEMQAKKMLLPEPDCGGQPHNEWSQQCVFLVHEEVVRRHKEHDEQRTPLDSTIFIERFLEQERDKTRRKKEKSKVEPQEMIALPSKMKNRCELSFRGDGKEFILPLKSEVIIRYDKDDDKFYYDDIDLELIDINPLKAQDLYGFDLWPLRLIYSALLQGVFKDLDKGILAKHFLLGYAIEFDLNELGDALCRKGNLTKQEAADMLSKIASYNHAVGIIYREHTKRDGTVYYEPVPKPLLMPLGKGYTPGTIAISSPYLNMLVYETIKDEIYINDKGAMDYKKRVIECLSKENQYLVKTTLAKERNKRAAEIVVIVCNTIAEAGDKGVPHISARTILGRHAELWQALEKKHDDSNKNKLLKSSFKKAWELLRTQTILEDVYEDIKLPELNEVPTIATLDRVFEFPHKGKKKRANKEVVVDETVE